MKAASQTCGKSGKSRKSSGKGKGGRGSGKGSGKPRGQHTRFANAAEDEDYLGYLKWKSEWWEDEFARLKGATGLQLDFSNLASGEELDTKPIAEMMSRFEVKQGDCESLERFLDSSTAEVNELDLELRRLRNARAMREDEANAGFGGGGFAVPKLNLEEEVESLQSKADMLEEQRGELLLRDVARDWHRVQPEAAHGRVGEQIVHAVGLRA